MKKIILLLIAILFSVIANSQSFIGSTGPITDNNCDATHDFPVTVSGIGVLGSSFSFNNIQFNITHTYDSDLDITLIAPNGITVDISSDNGGNGDNYANTVIAYSATASITTGTAPFTGTYLPEGNLGVLNGVNADGIWILRICDDASGGFGTLNAFVISFGAPWLQAENDNCSTAISLTVNPDFACGAVSNGTVYGATASPVDGNVCGGSEDDDVWFSFVATATTHRISLMNVMGSYTDLFHSLWTGTDCNSLSLVPGSCSDANISNPAGLISGQAYYVRVFTVTPNPMQLTNFSICVGSPPTAPDYVSLESPATASIAASGNFTVYGQIYKAGLTDITSGQAPGVQAWVGISPVGSNTNPSTWTNWTLATFNQEVGNNDEYMATIGSTLAPGIYYYATRFQQPEGSYYYGGIDSLGNGNFWDGTTYLSGVLTVNNPTVPSNDDCLGAIPLTMGTIFSDFPVTGTVYGATDSSSSYVINCDGINTTVNSAVFYSVTVPAAGSLTVETKAATSSSLTDTVLLTSVGSCSSLIGMTCNNNNGSSLFSKVTMFGQSPGSTVYVAVYKQGSFAPSVIANQFQVSAYTATLDSNSFDMANFNYHPNPVKNQLNLSYNQEISNVEVFNLLGQKMISKTIQANVANIDFSNLSKGIYLVNVSSANQIKTIKIVKD